MQRYIQVAERSSRWQVLFTPRFQAGGIPNRVILTAAEIQHWFASCLFITFSVSRCTGNDALPFALSLSSKH